MGKGKPDILYDTSIMLGQILCTTCQMQHVYKQTESDNCRLQVCSLSTNYCKSSVSQGQRSEVEVKVKGRGQRSRSRSKVGSTANIKVKVPLIPLTGSNVPDAINIHHSRNLFRPEEGESESEKRASEKGAMPAPNYIFPFCIKNMYSKHFRFVKIIQNLSKLRVITSKGDSMSGNFEKRLNAILNYTLNIRHTKTVAIEFDFFFFFFVFFLQLFFFRDPSNFFRSTNTPHRSNFT